MLDRFFQITARGSTPGRETAAGAVTFLTMAYIIFVNPSILAATGMDKGAVITATILASACGTLLAGLWARVPFAMAPGMGLNAFFAYSLVLGKGVSWQTALGVVFISGVAFLLLTLVGARRHVVNAIPEDFRLAIAAGIGLFIAFIGLRNLGLVTNSEATLVQLGHLDTPVVLGLAGLLVIIVMTVRGLPGGIMAGILTTTILALATGLITPPPRLVTAPPSLGPVLLKMDVAGALAGGMWGAIFSFMFVDLFDSVGTIVACSYQAGLVREDGSITGLDRVLEADAVATVAGAVLGTSTTTTYIESAAGIAQGGRTGLTSVVTAGLFLTALPLTPLIGMVPSYATGPALVMVGMLMFRNVTRIRWSDMTVAVPAFLAMVLMPLTYSISMGLAFGFTAHVLVMAVTGKARTVHPLLWFVAAFSLLEIFLAAAGS